MLFARQPCWTAHLPLLADNCSMAMTALAGPNSDLALSRPQIGIDRLPVRRSSGEPKEAMNCKSCRKRKVDLS